MSTNLTTPQDESKLLNDPQVPAPTIGKLGHESETSKDPFFPNSVAPGGKRLRKPASSPAKKTKSAAAPIQALPRELNVVPSLDLIKDYVAYADRWENPAIMHEFMIIAGIAALVNGKVWIKNGGLRLPLDFWVVLLSLSGSGRNTLVNEFRDVMTAAGLSGLIKQEAWGSASYIEEYFSEDSTGLFIWPEMSHVLNQFKQRHYAGAQEWITNLYDEKTPPSSKHYRTSAKEENQTPAIEFSKAPRTCFIATSSKAWFFKAVTKESVTGGFIPRWTPVIADQADRSVPSPREADPTLIPPMAEKLKIISSLEGEMDFSAVRPMYDDWYPRAKGRFQSNPNASFAMPFWNRYRQHVLKLAAIYELATSGSLTVSSDSMKRAIETGNWIEANIFELIGSSFTNEGIESQSLEDYIREGKQEGRSTSHFHAAFRSEERPKLHGRVNMLLEAELVFAFVRKTSGRPATYFVHADYFDAYKHAYPKDTLQDAPTQR
jgi:hypothetical protein